MAHKADTTTLIAETQSKLRDLEDAIAGLREERQKKLLADIDNGREPNGKKIDTRIRELSVEADGVRDLIAAFERRAGEEQKAKAQKHRAAQIERVENLTRQRVENGKKIEAAISTLVETMTKDIELSKALAAAWPWDTSGRSVLKLYGVGIKQLVAHENYRQSALAFLSNVGDNQVALPGSVCPRDDWRLQPEKIPSLVKSLDGIADYASRTMRNQPLPKTPAPKPVPARPKLVAPIANGGTAAVDTKSAPTVSIEEAQMRANVAAAERRRRFGEP